jgi:hypothetical protein
MEPVGSVKGNNDASYLSHAYVHVHVHGLIILVYLYTLFNLGDTYSNHLGI